MVLTEKDLPQEYMMFILCLMSMNVPGRMIRLFIMCVDVYYSMLYVASSHLDFLYNCDFLFAKKLTNK